jgi:hypothetical protein
VIGPDAMVSRGFELTPQEHAARQVCKILGAGSLDSEGLRSRWLAIQHETSARSRSGTDARTASRLRVYGAGRVPFRRRVVRELRNGYPDYAFRQQE